METTWIEINFAIDPDDYRRFKKHADDMGSTVPGLMRRQIEDYLRKQEEAQKKK